MGDVTPDGEHDDFTVTGDEFDRCLDRAEKAEAEVERLRYAVERRHEELNKALAEVERLREAIASAAISIASGPARDDYAYRVLTEALDG